MSLVSSVCQPSTLRMLICPEASKARNSMASVSAEARTIYVLIRRLNSSWESNARISMEAPTIAIRTAPQTDRGA
jgi:hypothetical protein